MRVHILWALAASAAFTPPQPPARRATVCFGGRPKNKAAKAAQKRLQEAAKEEAKAARTYEALQKKRRESKARRTERLRGRDTRGGTPDVVETTEKKVRRPPPTTPRAEPAKGQAKRPIQIKQQLEARFLGSYTTPDETPRDPFPEIAFVGRSNVGKSSMLNALVGARKGVAVTGRTPGRTRLLNLFEIEDSGGGRARVVDLPGYGFAKIADAQQAEIAAQLAAVASICARRPNTAFAPVTSSKTGLVTSATPPRKPGTGARGPGPRRRSRSARQRSARSSTS